MALRPGSRLLISSHFMPLPRNSMINASSSADHFDCFLAGDSAGWAERSRFAGIDGGIVEVVGVMEIGAGTDVALARSGGMDVFVIGAAEGAITAGAGGEIEVDVETGGVVDADADAVAALALVTLSALLFSSSSSSSSCGFNRSEISTLAVGIWGLVCTDIICAAFLFRCKCRGIAARAKERSTVQKGRGTMKARERERQERRTETYLSLKEKE